MFTLITWLSIIVCILLIAIVLIQNPKGGGLAANFSSANQILGVNRTTEGVEKITWILAISLLANDKGSSSTNFQCCFVFWFHVCNP